MKKRISAVVLGDSFNNTLGLIRSLGRAGAEVMLILIGEHDRLFLAKSRYLKKDNVFQFENLESAYKQLIQLGDKSDRPYLISSNDHAAEFIDSREVELNKIFRTPMSGKQLGKLFDKDVQLVLAKECEVTIPYSLIWNKGDDIPTELKYPVLTKPVSSNRGSKSDIHICDNESELMAALNMESECTEFLIQEYVRKEYELNLIGVSTAKGVYIPGAVKKLRHYPTIYSPCSYGCYMPLSEFDIDPEPLKQMIKRSGYLGPFSIELLHADEKNYFMEINFRHDGLAYTVTKAGINLLDLYVNDRPLDNIHNPKVTYMMDLSTDYCHVKDGDISRSHWFKDFLRTNCQLNFDPSDPMPTIAYYLSKFSRRYRRGSV